jgi:radical SAM superfamily enzyme YgiQ (UPF0313 family)
MKTTLVFPPFYLASLYNLPPLGLVSLGTTLRQAGHQVAIIDLVLAIRNNSLSLGATIYEDSVAIILQEEPDMVCFSVQCTTFPAVLQIAKRLKIKNPALLIVLGGHDVSFVDQTTLEKFPWIDLVVRGEGERTLLELADAIAGTAALHGIAGLTWRSNDHIIRNDDRDLITNLDELPLPDYSLVPPLAHYRDACHIPRSIAILEVGRGCPHQCIYCSESVMWRRQSRTFSIPRIINEMGRLRDDYGAECFLLAYDQFTANRQFVETFCAEIIAAGLQSTPWYCISRLDSMDRQLLRLMRQAGCESMCYGIDSGSKQTLAFIRKHIDASILLQRVRETMDEGMVPTLSFVIGFPEETRQDIDATLTLALKTGIQGTSNPLLQLPTVLPGTELYHRYGSTLVREADTYFSLGLEFDNGRRLEEDSRLMESEPLLFSSFYNLPCAGMSLQELGMLTAWFPLIINLYPKSFLVLAVALNESLSCLFAGFLGYVAKAEQLTITLLTADYCRQYLQRFAKAACAKVALRSWAHLSEIITYESSYLSQDTTHRANTPGTADLCQLAEQLPVADAGFTITEFSWNIPLIIDDLKQEVFCARYEEEQTILVFVRQANGIEVLEINDFGRDLLQLFNTAPSLNAVVESLHPLHGGGMKMDNFLQECREALQQLAEMGIPVPAQLNQ